ncbi:MAG: NAD-dependent epimerase/dehydratase family protein, partial [Polyangiaceae bacterium]|nr:NAD-dependent epimerase/dehydratase family protein [Polyangiaceae bacterium]
MKNGEKKVALVVGAQGVIGRGLVDHLATLEDWTVVGLSRRGGPSTERVRQLAVDLLDPHDTKEKLGDLRDVTHVFYAAYQDRPTWAELVAPNVAMLRNV